MVMTMSVCCRYVVRVVAGHQPTNVAWRTSDRGVTANGNAVLNRGKWKEIYVSKATQPLRIVCDQPCEVMLYNTGKVHDILYGRLLSIGLRTGHHSVRVHGISHVCELWSIANDISTVSHRM